MMRSSFDAFAAQGNPVGLASDFEREIAKASYEFTATRERESALAYVAPSQGPRVPAPVPAPRPYRTAPDALARQTVRENLRQMRAMWHVLQAQDGGG